MNELDAASLVRAGRQVREPFQLSLNLTSGAATMSVRKVHRLLPGKRIVALAEDASGPLLIKVFVGRFAGRYARRERQGAEAIADAGVPTPGFRWQASLQSGGGYVLAFDYLEHARNLIDEWEEADSREARIALIAGVMPVLARLHEAGVVQNDIHPENFLMNQGEIFTIDGGDVTRHSTGPLSELASLENLALFFAQFRTAYDDLLPEALARYEASRDWPADVDRLGRLVEAVIAKREKRKNDYIDKAFRECTRFSCRRSFMRFEVCERSFDSPAMRDFLKDLDGAIARGHLLKDGHSATVARVDSPCGPLVVKRYNIKNGWHRLRRMFRRSRAWVSWANSHRLDFLGIKTVKPVALVEERFGPLRSRAFFVTEYVHAPDASTLEEPMEDQVRAIVDLLKSLSMAGVSHGDLKATNLLLSDEGAVILDLDSMTEHADADKRRTAQKRDLERFLKNWEFNPSLEQRFTDLLE